MQKLELDLSRSGVALSTGFMGVVFVAGIFDMLHAGHLNLLRKMRSIGDTVVVIVHDDESCFKIKDKFPIQELKHRVRNIKSTGLADEIIVCRNTDPHKEFKMVVDKYVNPLYIRGDDLKKGFPGQWYLKEKGIKIKFIPYTKGVSSTKLRDKL